LQEIGLFVIAYIADIACSSFYLHSNVYYIITIIITVFPSTSSNGMPSLEEAIWGGDLDVLLLFKKIIRDIITDYRLIFKYHTFWK
jgi:hypothetical protein